MSKIYDKKATPKQQALYDALKESIGDKGGVPNYSALGRYFNINPTAVRHRRDGLISKGYIKQHNRKITFLK